MSNKFEKTKLGVYIDLDCLLDTRFTTLFDINPDLAIEELKDAKYFRRKDDIFEDFPEFQKRYSKRDNDVLRRSVMTNIMDLLGELLHTFAGATLMHPIVNDVRVIVNSFPYKLTEEEEHLIGEKIRNYTEQDNLKVEWINHNPSLLSIAWMDSYLNHIFCYDFDLMFGNREKEWKNKKLTEKCVYIPAIQYKEKPTEEQEREMKELYRDCGHLNFFEWLIDYCRFFFTLYVVPVEYYCLFNLEGYRHETSETTNSRTPGIKTSEPVLDQVYFKS